MKRKFGTVSNLINAGVQAYGAYRAAKRLRTRTATRVGRRRVSGGSFNSGYMMRNMKAVNTKRRRSRRSKKRMFRKMLKKNIGISGKLLKRFMKRMKAMNEQEFARGALALGSINYQPALNADIRWQVLPCMLFELNSPEATRVFPHWTLCFNRHATIPTNTDRKLYQFVSTKSVYKLDNDGEIGGNSYNLVGNGATFPQKGTAYYDPNGAVDVGNISKYFQHSVKANLIMYGQTNQDTLFRVDVVKFSDKFCEFIDGQATLSASYGFPTSISDSPEWDSSGTVQQKTDWNTFWHSMIAPYTQNPMAKRYRPRGCMKIIKSYKFKIPEKSSEFDQQPCVKTKFTIPINKILDRYWHRGVTSYAPLYDPENGSIMNNPDYDTLASLQDMGPKNSVRPKDRLFLLIRATNTDMKTIADDTVNISSGEDPTFDITLESLHSYQ